MYIPHIFSGASNSRRIGWERKISRLFKHRPRISLSVNWTFFPGLEPRTADVKTLYALHDSLRDAYRTTHQQNSKNTNLKIILAWSAHTLRILISNTHTNISNNHMSYKGAVTNNGKETELSHNLNVNEQIGVYIYLLITEL